MGFNTILGQCCYLRMGQGLTRAPETYSKRIWLWGPSLGCTLSLPLAALPDVGFLYFMDDADAARGIGDMIRSLSPSSLLPKTCLGRSDPESGEEHIFDLVEKFLMPRTHVAAALLGQLRWE
ncbi:hypothetical protein GB937_002248 [Aspergillus fischeri]|nr:hypothetical protein GB937_002248 [Aspergillus fischeri]